MILTSTGRHHRTWMDAPTRLLLPIPEPMVYGAHARNPDQPDPTKVWAAVLVNAGTYVGAGRHALRDDR